MHFTFDLQFLVWTVCSQVTNSSHISPIP